MVVGLEESLVLKEDIYLLLVLISALESYLLLESSSSLPVDFDAISSILTSWSEHKDAEVEQKIFQFTETTSFGNIFLPHSSNTSPRR